MSRDGVAVAIVAGMGGATALVPMALMRVLPGESRTSPSSIAIAAFPLVGCVGLLAVVWVSLASARRAGGGQVHTRGALIALSGYLTLFVAALALGLGVAYEQAR